MPRRFNILNAPNGVVQTPSDIFGANLRQWINFDRDATVTGGNIERADDLSGNNLDIRQTVVANRPSENATGLNGKRTAVFDGATEYLVSIAGAASYNFLHQGGNACAIVVAKAGTSSNPNASLTFLGNGGATSIATGIFLFYDDRASVSRNNALRSLVSKSSTGNFVINDEVQNSVTPNQFNYIQWDIDTNNGTAADRSKFYYNGSALAQNNTQTNSPNAGIPTYTMNYGRSPVSGGISYLDGEIAEIILLDAHPTAQQRTDLATYFADEWGL